MPEELNAAASSGTLRNANDAPFRHDEAKERPWTSTITEGGCTKRKRPRKTLLAKWHAADIKSLPKPIGYALDWPCVREEANCAC